MQPMKTRTVQDVPRPPFAEWYCEIKGITGTSMFRAKLEMMNILRSVFPHEPIPEFLSDVIHKVKGKFTPVVKAITDSPKVDKIEFTYTRSTLYAEIKFKTGQTIVLSESRKKLYEEVEKTTGGNNVLTADQFQDIVCVRLLRRFFRRSDFMDLI